MPEEQLVTGVANLPVITQDPFKTPLTGQFPSFLKYTPPSASSSTSSKGKRWKDKLINFHKSNQRKKASLTPGSKTLSHSPAFDSSPSHRADHYPFRTTSLPDDTSIHLHDKVTHPYIFNKREEDNPFSKKSFLKATCTLCEEPISNRGNGERIIELTCSHLAHQECFTISFGDPCNFNNLDIYSLFPTCIKCQTLDGKKQRCIPTNDELKDTLISEFLVQKNHISSEAHAAQTFLSPLSSTLPSPIQHVQQQFLLQKQPEMKPVHLNTPSLSTLHKNREEHSRNRGALNGTITSRAELRDDHTTHIPILRSYFIQLLLRNFPKQLVDWEIDSEFGLLRLVDTFLVSTDQTNFSNCCCFLFEHTLAIAEIGQVKHINDAPLKEIELLKLNLYYLSHKMRIDTVESSMVKVVTSDSPALYLTETTDGMSTKITEKWISGLLDNTLMFDDSSFTSTLDKPLVIPSNDIDNTLTGLMGPHKVMGVTNIHNRGSILLKRSITTETTEDDRTELGTVHTMATTISAMLALKRETPNDFLVILQLDFTKLKADTDFLIIFNSLKALSQVYEQLKICIVSKDADLLKCGLLNKILATIDDLKQLQTLKSKTLFSPRWLCAEFYSGTVNTNVGIAILSNSSMESTKSCLLMDFRAFATGGRKKPNEVKVKIGYLNTDYSDRIRELLEIDSWGFMLETLAYSFSLSFGEDLDDSRSVESASSTSSNASDTASTTTLLISSPTKSYSNMDGSSVASKKFLLSDWQKKNSMSSINLTSSSVYSHRSSESFGQNSSIR